MQAPGIIKGCFQNLSFRYLHTFPDPITLPQVLFTSHYHRYTVIFSKEQTTSELFGALRNCSTGRPYFDLLTPTTPFLLHPHHPPTI